MRILELFFGFGLGHHLIEVVYDGIFGGFLGYFEKNPFERSEVCVEK